MAQEICIYTSVIQSIHGRFSDKKLICRDDDAYVCKQGPKCDPAFLQEREISQRTFPASNSIQIWVQLHFTEIKTWFRLYPIKSIGQCECLNLAEKRISLFICKVVKKSQTARSTDWNVFVRQFVSPPPEFGAKHKGSFLLATGHWVAQVADIWYFTTWYYYRTYFKCHAENFCLHV